MRQSKLPAPGVGGLTALLPSRRIHLEASNLSPSTIRAHTDDGALLADCSGKDFRNRRDCAIIRLFLDTGMRLEGLSGLRYRADDLEFSDVDLTSRVARITAKGRRELVLPIGAKTARDIDRYIRVRAAHPRAADPWLWLRKRAG